MKQEDISESEAALDAALTDVEHHRLSGSQEDIASSLEHLSYLSLSLDRDAEALTYIVEAVKLRRNTKAEDGESDSALYKSLQQLSQALVKVDRVEEAIPFTHEAISILRTGRTAIKSKSQPEADSELAGTLHNLGFYYGLAEHWSSALTAVDEAISLRRALRKEDVQKYTPQLASSLHNRSFYLSNLNKHHPAIVASTESAQLLRSALPSTTSKEQYIATCQALSESLHSLSTHQFTAKQHYAASTTSSANLEVIWDLIWSDSPSNYINHLTTTLHNSSTQLNLAGRRAEAITAAEESVHIRRDLARDDPQTHLPHLAHSLASLAISLEKTNRSLEALMALEESIAILRELPNQDKYQKRLAVSLYNFADYCEREKRDEDAKKAYAEAFELCPELRALRARSRVKKVWAAIKSKVPKARNRHVISFKGD